MPTLPSARKYAFSAWASSDRAALASPDDGDRSRADGEQEADHHADDRYGGDAPTSPESSNPAMTTAPRNVASVIQYVDGVTQVVAAFRSAAWRTLRS